MSRYLVRRLAFAIFLVIAVSSASLVLARLAPGDFVASSLGGQASAQEMAQARARLGLDKSIGAQYVGWIPAAAIGLPLAAMLERVQAQATRETVDQPFVLATLARGVPPARILWRDALKPALRPVASVYGLIIGTLLSGSFAVEVITAWPGLGNLMLNALRARD